jgi:hypothetical protein
VVCRAFESGDTGEIDDGAAAVVDEPPRGGLGTEEDSPDVDVHEELVLLFGHLEKLFGAKHASVVDHVIDTAEGLGGLDGGVEVIRIGDVRFDERRLDIVFLGNEFVGRLAALAWLLTDVRDDDVCSLLGEPSCDFPSVPARCACNYRCVIE